MFYRILPSLLITSFLALLPFVFLSIENKRAALYDLTFTLPYLSLILVAFLGEKLNQRRILLAALSLALTCAYLSFDLPEALAPHSIPEKGQLLGIALPITLYLCFALEESWLRGPQVLLFSVAVNLPLFLADALYSTPQFYGVFQGRLFDGVFFSHLSNAAVFLALSFAAMTYFTQDRYLQQFRLFFSVGLMPLLYAFERTSQVVANVHHFRLEVSLAYLSTAAVLLYACFHLYWQKVYIDELTGVPNRRALNEKLRTLREDYCIAMIDIDNFKQFNDAYGHEQGDSVLKLVASQFRTPDHGEVYRYGGEEFCIVFHRISLAHAADIAEGMREKLSRRPFYIRPSRENLVHNAKLERGRGAAPHVQRVQITISVGVAQPTHLDQRPEEVLAQADQVLLKAKKTGRNRVLAS